MIGQMSGLGGRGRGGIGFGPAGPGPRPHRAVLDAGGRTVVDAGQFDPEGCPGAAGLGPVAERGRGDAQVPARGFSCAIGGRDQIQLSNSVLSLQSVSNS